MHPPALQHSGIQIFVLAMANPRPPPPPTPRRWKWRSRSPPPLPRLLAGPPLVPMARAEKQAGGSEKNAWVAVAATRIAASRAKSRGGKAADGSDSYGSNGKGGEASGGSDSYGSKGKGGEASGGPDSFGGKGKGKKRRMAKAEMEEIEDLRQRTAAAVREGQPVQAEDAARVLGLTSRLLMAAAARVGKLEVLADAQHKVIADLTDLIEGIDARVEPPATAASVAAARLLFDQLFEP